MNVRNLLAGTALATALLIAGTPRADAGVLPIGGYTGPLQLNFDNYESFLTSAGVVDPLGPQVGDQNVGIFAVTSIVVPGLSGATLWSQGDGGIRLAGTFNGIMVAGVNNPGTATETTTNTGGVFSLWSVINSQFLGDLGTIGYSLGGCSGPIGGTCYHGITDRPSSTPVLTMTLTTGIDAFGNTLDASVNASLNPPSGNAAFWGLISGNSQLNPRVFGKDSFCPNAAPTCPGSDGTDFQLASQDPIAGAAVPEPGSLAILGGGLLFLQRFRARRQKKTNTRP